LTGNHYAHVDKLNASREPRAVIRWWLVGLTLGGIVATAGCVEPNGEPASAIAVTAAQWPRADALFHRNSRWLGSDGAYSIPLHDGRILWLFGDTLVATTPAHVRSEAAFVRNTVAIERATNPSTASMRFYWRKTGTGPASYFPEDGARWFWPKHGIRLGRSLFVFLSRVETNPSGPPGWNFEGAGWRLAVVEDASGSPAQWQVRLVTPPRVLADLDVGNDVNLVDGYVVSLAVPAQGNAFSGYLVRWRLGEFAAGRLDKSEWWAGGRGWVQASDRGPRPSPIMANAGPESSLTFDSKLDRWIFVRSEGFGATTIIVSFAPKIEGPWSNPKVVFRPPESNNVNANVYAAKGHPELTGADLAVTYATSTYPRFVRLTFSRHH
jgi:hypothetical protein